MTNFERIVSRVGAQLRTRTSKSIKKKPFRRPSQTDRHGITHCTQQRVFLSITHGTDV